MPRILRLVVRGMRRSSRAPTAGSWRERQDRCEVLPRPPRDSAGGRELTHMASDEIRQWPVWSEDRQVSYARWNGGLEVRVADGGKSKRSGWCKLIGGSVDVTIRRLLETPAADPGRRSLAPRSPGNAGLDAHAHARRAGNFPEIPPRWKSFSSAGIVLVHHIVVHLGGRTSGCARLCPWAQPDQGKRKSLPPKLVPENSGRVATQPLKGC